jgi:hypothetical protein
VSPQRKNKANYMPVPSVADVNVGRYWQLVLNIGSLFSSEETSGFGCYYFTEVGLTLLPAGSG